MSSVTNVISRDETQKWQETGLFLEGDRCKGSNTLHKGDGSCTSQLNCSTPVFNETISKQERFLLQRINLLEEKLQRMRRDDRDIKLQLLSTHFDNASFTNMTQSQRIESLKNKLSELSKRIESLDEQLTNKKDVKMIDNSLQ